MYLCNWIQRDDGMSFCRAMSIPPSLRSRSLFFLVPMVGNEAFFCTFFGQFFKKGIIDECNKQL
jgi:hypothetical protein